MDQRSLAIIFECPSPSLTTTRRRKLSTELRACSRFINLAPPCPRNVLWLKAGVSRQQTSISDRENMDTCRPCVDREKRTSDVPRGDHDFGDVFPQISVERKRRIDVKKQQVVALFVRDPMTSNAFIHPEHRVFARSEVEIRRHGYLMVRL